MSSLVPNPRSAQSAYSSQHLTGKLTDPFLLGFMVLYGLAFLGLVSAVPGEWQSALFLATGVVIVSAVVLVLFRGQIPHPVDTVRSRIELWLALMWFLGVYVLAAFTDAHGMEVVNGFTNWLFLFLVPLGFLRAVRGGSLRETLSSAGLTRCGLGTALKMMLLTVLLFLPVILGSVNGEQREEILAVFFTPARLAIVFPVSFVLALLLAGFTEEFFFRGVLQSRLAVVTGSEMRGLVVASLLFGVLHFPHAYFLSTWPTHENLVWSLATVMTEYAITGVLLGVLWIKTHNLAASALVHSFVNALVLMTSIRIGVG